MIRVSIIADTPARARNIANLLAEDERLEIIEARSAFADVIVAFGIAPHQLPNDSNVVFLSDELDPLPVQADGARARFGRAWLSSQTSAGELIAAVIAAASNLTVLTPSQARRWLTREIREANPDAAPGEALTGREMQVLRMLSNGLGNKEIAGHLGISDHTAKFHVAQILAKLNAGSRTEAVAIAIRRGLVPV